MEENGTRDSSKGWAHIEGCQVGNVIRLRNSREEAAWDSLQQGSGADKTLPTAMVRRDRLWFLHRETGALSLDAATPPHRRPRTRTASATQGFLEMPR